MKMQTLITFALVLGHFSGQENVDDLVKIRAELLASRQKINLVYNNCVIKFNEAKIVDGETQASSTRMFASRDEAIRVDGVLPEDPIAESHDIARCYNPSHTSFIAARDNPQDDYVIASMTTKDDQEARAHLLNSAFIGRAILGNGPFDLVDTISAPDTVVLGVKKYKDHGKQMLKIDFQHKDYLQLDPCIATYVFLGDVWVLSEFRNVQGSFRRIYEGEFKGVPLIKKLIYELDDKRYPDSPKQTQITEVLDFQTEAAPAEYFTLQGLNIDINRKSPLSFWIMLLVLGAGLVGTVSWLIRKS